MRSLVARFRLHARGASRGQVLIIVGVAMTVFIGVIGLAVDYGFWLTTQRALRNAADAASQAGVSELAELPVTAAKQTAASEHAMMYLNAQLGLGLSDIEIPVAAAAALAADGFGSEDPTSYSGTDRFLIRTPATAADSCTGRSWGKRSINVKVERQAARFFSGIFFGDTQGVDGCATSVIEGRGYAVAVLRPPHPSSQSQSISMRLDGSDSYVHICGGDVGINGLFRGGPAPPSPLVDPAFVKFMNANSTVPCLTDNENKMELTLDTPSPPTWDLVPPQVRSEGATFATLDDPYHAPTHLTSLIKIPTWGSAEYAALVLADAGDPVITMRDTDPGNGTCTPPVVPAPAGPYTDSVDPGKYDLLQVGVGQKRWLCPGVYHFVHTGGGTEGLDLGTDGVIGGQGVTLVFDSDSVIDIRSGAALLLNSAGAGGSQAPAPWMTGDFRHNVPITVYIEPDATCPAVPIYTCSESSVFTMQAGAGLDVRGVIFGPTDEMKIAGNGTHNGAGEIWAWTLEYKGQSTLRQDYEGNDLGYPLLVE